MCARLCSDALRCLAFSLNKRDAAVFMSSEEAPLPTRPFNHLSVLAYLAIGIVVFASSVVTGYLIHSCYRSASRKDATKDAFEEKSTTIVDVKSEAAYRRTGRREPGELELNPLAREFLDDEESFWSDNRTVIGKRSNSSLAKGTFTSPPYLAHSSDSTMASPSFCVHSPLSLSPAHQREIRHYAAPSPYSPVSSSSSFFRDSSPPSILSLYDERDWYAASEQQTTNISFEARRQAPRPGTQFDSNNIRYIPRLDPRVAESTVKLYNEPKLSPIIPPSPGDDIPLHVLAEPSSTNSSPISVPQKRVRVRIISGNTHPAIVLPRLSDSYHNDLSTNPISSRLVGGPSMLPTVRLKPGPGYF